MATTNEKLVLDWLAAGDSGELDAFDLYLHEDVVVHAPLGLSTVGIEAERAVWKTVRAGASDLQHQVQETVSAGPSVVARSVVTGTHLGQLVGLQPTGRQFRIDHVTFAHIRDGKIAEVWEIADSAALLEQLQ